MELLELISARVVVYPEDVAAMVVVTPSPPRLPVAENVTFQVSPARPPRVDLTPMLELLVNERLPRPATDAAGTLPVIVKAGDASEMFVDVALFVQDV